MIQVLEKHSLNVKSRFKPQKMPLKLNNKQSTMSFQMGPEAPEIVAGDWLRVDSGPAEGIVWRAKSVETGYDANTRTVSCEHIINVLSDYLIFGEITPAEITGDPNATECEANDALQYIMSKQSDWRAGAVLANETMAYTFNGDDVKSAVETLSGTLQAQEWFYDMSRYPFVLSMGPNAASTQWETRMRMNRNIKTIRMIVDITRMCTRFYPIGQNDLHLPEEFISRNENLYGTICRTETNENMTTVDDLRKWANGWMAGKAEPQVTVTITGMDLSKATGEDMDKFRLGTPCEVPLPEYGTTIRNTIVELSWQDAENRPEEVTVTLSNVREDVASLINKLQKQSKSRGRTGATNTSKNTKKINGTLKDVTLTGPVNNVYTLRKQLNTGEILPIGTFSRAVTSWRTSASAGRIRVTAVPQEQTKEIRVRTGDDTWSKAAHQHTGPIQYSSNDGASWTNTGANYSVNAAADYNYGRDSVEITRVDLATNLDYLGNSAGDTRNLIYIQVDLNSGKSKTDTLFTLGYSKYADNTKWGATLKNAAGQTLGRADLAGVYNDGAASVTVTRIDLADNYSYLGDTAGDTRTNIYIQADASNGAKKDDKLLQLGVAKYASNSKWGCALLDADGNKLGRADLTTVYNDGIEDGKKQANVTLTRSAVTTDSQYQKHLTYTAANASNAQKTATETIYLVKNGNKAQLRKDSATGTLIMEINTT